MKPSAILTADWHLRDTAPISRCDNYWEDMWESVDFLVDLSIKHKCPILDAGDLLNKWKASSALLYTFIKKMPKGVLITIPGNHDLPNHNLKEFWKSGLGVLGLTGITVLIDKWELFPNFAVYGSPYGSDIYPEIDISKKSKVLLSHEIVWDDKPLYPGLTNKTQALKVMEKYPEFDLIVTGHNHQSFTVEHEGRLLVNCGSLKRMYADQKDFKPRVWLWYEETNTVEPVYLPIKEDAFNIEHLEKNKKNKERKDDLTEKLSDCEDVLPQKYEQNVKEYIETNRIRSKTKSLILECLE